MGKWFLKFFLFLLVVTTAAFSAFKLSHWDIYQPYGWVDRHFANVSFIREALDQSAGQCTFGQTPTYVRRGENWEALGADSFPFGFPVKILARPDALSGIQPLWCLDSTGEKFSLLLWKDYALQIDRAKGHPLRIRAQENAKFSILGKNLKLIFFTQFGDLTISSQGDTNLFFNLEGENTQTLAVKRSNVSFSLPEQSVAANERASLLISGDKDAQLSWGQEKKILPSETVISVLPSGIYFNGKK